MFDSSASRVFSNARAPLQVLEVPLELCRDGAFDLEGPLEGQNGGGQVVEDDIRLGDQTKLELRGRGIALQPIQPLPRW